MLFFAVLLTIRISTTSITPWPEAGYHLHRLPCHHLRSTARQFRLPRIEEPPSIYSRFATRTAEFLPGVNQVVLVKAKPPFNQRTFLKPRLHQSPDSAALQKVLLPRNLNGYKCYAEGSEPLRSVTT